jgi:hypothetical protein
VEQKTPGNERGHLAALLPHEQAGRAALIKNKDKKMIKTMKQTGIFTRINFTLCALALLLAGTLLFTGCTTAGSSDSIAADHSGHQGSCH